MSFTDFKEVSSNNSGSSTRYGGNDLKELMQILNDKTVSNRRVSIKNPWIWTNYFDVKAPGSAPAAPSDTNTNRVYTDPSDNKLKVRKTAGTIVDLENAAGGAVGDVFLNQTNTYGDFDSIFRSSRVKIRNPANTFSYSLVGSAIAAARNVTIPLLAADDTLVTQAFGQPLSGKTVNVDQNTIKHSTTNAAGDLLKGDGTSLVRFARGTANQVLAVNAGGTDVAWTTPAGGGNVSTTSSNAYGDFDQIFRSGRLDIRNPADTFSYSVVGSAITTNRNIILPLLTADDTVATLDFAQTLINKTINIDANTIKHSTTNAAGDLLESSGTSYQRLPRGSANQVLTVNSGGTDITWQDPAAGAGSLTFLPDATNSGKHWGIWMGGARRGTGLFADVTILPNTVVTQRHDSTTGTKVVTDLVTTGTTATTFGIQGAVPISPATGWYAARNQNFRFKARFQVDVTTNKRFAIGLAGTNTLPTNNDAYLGSAIPGFIFRYSSTTDTTIKLLRNDNVGTAVTVDTGVTLAANTPVTIEIIADEPNTRIGWAINGGAITYYTTDIPAATQSLNYFCTIETKLTSTAVRLQLYYVYLTQDVV